MERKVAFSGNDRKPKLVWGKKLTVPISTRVNHSWSDIGALEITTETVLTSNAVPTERFNAGQIVGNPIKMCRSGQKMEM